MGKVSVSKSAISASVEVFCGIDVSAATLAVAVPQVSSSGLERREFANTAAGHKSLIGWLGRHGLRVRVSLETTGIYSLDLALALDAAEGIEIAMLNPKLACRFAQTLSRSKTDKADALALALYGRRMPFEPWQRPSRAALELRAITRHIATLAEEHARMGNRLHAAEDSEVTPRCVRNDLRRSMAALAKRILKLRREAVVLVGKDARMQRRFEHLVGIAGVAETSAVQLLAELAGLDPEMSARQWVAS